MSEIQRFDPCDECSCLDMSDRQGLYVLFTDHEAAIALTARMCVEAFDAELARTEERVLADAKARIEGLLENGHNTGSQDWYFNEGLREALAALTQPQTERERFGSRPYTPEQREFMEKVVSERQPLPQPVFPLEDDGGGAAAEKCPEDCDGFGQLIGDSDGPCPACSGLEPDRGGAAAEKCPNPDCEGGTRPNGEGGWDMCPDCLEAANADGGGAATAAGVADADLGLPLTNSTLVEEVVAAVYEACLDRAMGEEDASEVAAVLRGQLTGTRPTPTPYAKAFRERVCPVPEFPSIRETAHEAIIEGGCCIQCGLPNNSETVLFHSCQAGAPADPTCPNTGHKFSHCDCDLGIEKEES